MRTSSSQFQLLVEYMERYGDLSKPAEGPQGRATNMQRWAELTQLLNADATGDTKTSEKWRKVWSDFKNNTKKKAARLYRAAQGTGGGPASKIKLSDLEERVLSLIGTQAATGIVEIPEIGLEEEVTQVDVETESPSIIQMQGPEGNSNVENWNQPSTSFQTLVLPIANEPELMGSGVLETTVSREAAMGNRSEGVTGGGPPVVRTPLPSMPPPPARPRTPQIPTPLPSTPRRRQRGRMSQDPSSPNRRRTRTQTQSELARQAFVRSDCEWRAFQQETERERIRMQEQWLDLFRQFIVLGNRFADILEKK